MIFPRDSMLFGKKIWYEPARIIDWHLDAKSTSQQVLDIYSITHISHGIIFFLISRLIGINVKNSIYVSLILEILYEIAFNSRVLIKIYINNWPNYLGDSLVNSTADIILTLLGVFIAMKNPVVGVLYVIISESILYKYSAGLFTHLQQFIERV